MNDIIVKNVFLQPQNVHPDRRPHWSLRESGNVLAASVVIKCRCCFKYACTAVTISGAAQKFRWRPVDGILRMRPTEASSSNVRFSRMARKNCFGNKTKAASGYHRFPDGSKCLGSCTVWKETTLDEQGRLMNNAYLTGSHPEHIPIVLGASLFIAWTKVNLQKQSCWQAYAVSFIVL